MITHSEVIHFEKTADKFTKLISQEIYYYYICDKATDEKYYLNTESRIKCVSVNDDATLEMNIRVQQLIDNEIIGKGKTDYFKNLVIELDRRINDLFKNHTKDINGNFIIKPTSVSEVRDAVISGLSKK